MRRSGSWRLVWMLLTAERSRPLPEPVDYLPPRPSTSWIPSTLRSPSVPRASDLITLWTLAQLLLHKTLWLYRRPYNRLSELSCSLTLLEVFIYSPFSIHIVHIHWSIYVNFLYGFILVSFASSLKGERGEPGPKGIVSLFKCKDELKGTVK